MKGMKLKMMLAQMQIAVGAAVEGVSLKRPVKCMQIRTNRPLNPNYVARKGRYKRSKVNGYSHLN